MTKTIQELRLAHGLTQAELGRLVGVNSTSVRRWEKGVVTPTVPKLRRCARLFAVPMEAISLVNEEALEQRALGTHDRKTTASTARKTRVA